MCAGIDELSLDISFGTEQTSLSPDGSSSLPKGSSFPSPIKDSENIPLRNNSSYSIIGNASSDHDEPEALAQSLFSGISQKMKSLQHELTSKSAALEATESALKEEKRASVEVPMHGNGFDCIRGPISCSLS